jgi:hypothetical protein
MGQAGIATDEASVAPHPLRSRVSRYNVSRGQEGTNNYGRPFFPQSP